MIENKKVTERAVLVGLITEQQDAGKLHEYLDELEFLVETSGAETLKRFWQKMQKPDSRYFVGSGKVEEIKEYIDATDADMVVFDDDLTPSQTRNLEKALEVKVVDRSLLILDIFAARAQTAYAKTQVELAQYQYLLPRLSGMWEHLQKQRGGVGMRGPGEKEIETDRRIIRDRIALLKERLREIDKQMTTQRKNRGDLVRVALVGYTNVGKSTLMNLLSKSDVFAENKLFATLDTTVRKVVINTLPFLLSDTVGFIRKLPTLLVEAFKSTLDEVREADILLHVVDISHPEFEDQIEVVNNTLNDIKAGDKPTIVVFNKIDNYSYVKKDEDDLTPVLRENFTFEMLKQSWMSKNNCECVFISAKDKENVDTLKDMLYKKVLEIHRLRYPFDVY